MAKPGQNIAKSILRYNAGRDPERLDLKLQALRNDAFAFFRGTCHLFYETLPSHPALKAAPAVHICGDLHLENFGSYKGDNRLVYFDLNDFDEAVLAPFTMELVRFLASIKVAAKSLQLPRAQADELCRLFVDVYRERVSDGKPRWLERATAIGMIADLLGNLNTRTRKQLLDERTISSGKKRRLRIDGRKALDLDAAQYKRVKKLIKRYARTTADPGFYKVLDIARRIAGNGSLGLERYAILVQGRGSPDQNFLLDLKIGNPSAVVPHVAERQPKWECEAQRVMRIQQLVQAIAPARMAVLVDGKKSFLLKELQPIADRLKLQDWNGRIGRLRDVIYNMAEATAWGHLRGCGRFGAALVDEFAGYAANQKWRKPLLELAEDSHRRVLAQWKTYCEAFDSGALEIRVTAKKNK
jgi:uncharacterized protein (DUF2252 family)